MYLIFFYFLQRFERIGWRYEGHPACKNCMGAVMTKDFLLGM